MAIVPQKVLSWLHSVLTNEYLDVPRTYSDAAQTLSQNQTLRPQTDVFTFETGRSSLLLHFTGTLPVSFRGAPYSFPISIWIPHTYPREAPMAFVIPTNDMIVRPAQHVSGEGRIYHPYLASWRPDRSNIVDLLRIMQDVFSREPPVISKNEQTPRPNPPLPPKPGRTDLGGQRSVQQLESRNEAPPPPPKPFDSHNRFQPLQSNGGPPLPPLPSLSGIRNASNLGSWPNDHTASFQSPPISGQHAPQRSSGLKNDYLPPDQGRQELGRYEQRGPYNPTGQFSPLPLNNHPSASASTQIHQHHYKRNGPQPPPLPGSNQAQGLTSNQPNYSHQSSLNRPQNQSLSRSQYPPYIPQQQPPPAPKPPEDLLTSPFDNPLPSQPQPTNIPAPPIPPNPEKDALLGVLSQTLTQHLQNTLTSNASALPPLRAQWSALQSTLQSIQQEKQSLTSLQALLASNESILHTAMHDADTCIANASHRTAPPVDEVLVAPTVVGEQLYELVAEERACVEARGVLGRALDRDRVGVEGWVKGVRGLAREEFLKKVLIRKCARGLGLREGDEWT